MKKLIIFLLLVGVGVGGWLYVKSGAEKAKPKVMAVEPLKKGRVREILEATGIIKSQVGASVEIGAQATGRIDRMLVKVGDRVQKGDLVAVIDDRELMTQKRRAEADRDAAVIARDYAVRDLKRQKELYGKKLVDKATLEEAEEKLRNAGAVVKARKADLELIDVRLTHTRIYSSITGQVSQVAAQEGETVVTGLEVANLVSVIDPLRLEMWIYMDETDIGRVEPGQEVEFGVDAYSDETFSTKIKEIYPQPEIKDNIVYYLALAEISSTQAEKLRPEMTTHCKVVVQSRDDVLALPNTALKWVEGDQVVFVVHGQGPDAPVERVKPELGLTGPTHSQILSGIKEGQNVATQIILPKSALGASPAREDKGPGR